MKKFLASLAVVSVLVTAEPALAERASWYGQRFHGQITASGEPYNMWEMTAAHRRLPLGTVVRVTNLRSGRSVRVRINDRGPYVPGRHIDLSKMAAHKLRMLENGVAPVDIEVIRYE